MYIADTYVADFLTHPHFLVVVLSAFGSLFEVYIIYIHVTHSLTYPLCLLSSCVLSDLGSLFKAYIAGGRVAPYLSYPLHLRSSCVLSAFRSLFEGYIADAHVAHSLLYSAIFLGSLIYNTSWKALSFIFIPSPHKLYGFG